MAKRAVETKESIFACFPLPRGIHVAVAGRRGKWEGEINPAWKAFGGTRTRREIYSPAPRSRPPAMGAAHLLRGAGLVSQEPWLMRYGDMGMLVWL